MRNKFFTDSLGCKCKVVRRKTPAGYTVIWCTEGRWSESRMFGRTPAMARKKYESNIDSFLDYVFADYYNKDCN